MSAAPKDGEIWVMTNGNALQRGDGLWASLCGWEMPSYEDSDAESLVGYTTEYVEKLRDRLSHSERDEAVRRAEAAEVALAERPTLDALAEREPWRILEAAADIVRYATTSAALRSEADDLEREHAERLDRLIEKAAAILGGGVWSEKDCLEQAKALADAGLLADKAVES